MLQLVRIIVLASVAMWRIDVIQTKRRHVATTNFEAPRRPISATEYESDLLTIHIIHCFPLRACVLCVHTQNTFSVEVRHR